jgi:hypothetical protein
MTSLIGESLCPSAKVDSELRDQLVALRPKPGEATGMRPHFAVEILQGDDERGMVIIPIVVDECWNSRAARKGFVRMIGEYFAQENLQPTVIYLVSEAWAKSWPQGEEPKGPIDLRLQEVKREIVMACALTIDGRVGQAHAEILRDDEARISGYGEIESIPCGTKQDNGEPAVEANLLKHFFQSYVQGCVNFSA